jgi:SNW domain-containing protein 1
MLAKYNNLANKNATINFTDEELAKPGIDVLTKTINQSAKSLEKASAGKAKLANGATMLSSHININKDAKFIRYTASQQGLNANTEGHQRIIRLSDIPRDPLEPPKYKQKKIPRGNNEQAVAVMHSPPRKLTMKDQQDWKVPPCISNWKNGKGYTIPLEMRISADGRNNRTHTISQEFSKFADVLYVTELQARQEIAERNKMQEAIRLSDTLKKEQELKNAAKQAREQKMSLAVSNISSVNTTKTDDVLLGNKTDREMRSNKLDVEREAEIQERNALRNMRKREIERDRRMEVSASTRRGKNKMDTERDISEKVALGQAQPTMTSNMIDSRLYNQTAGMDTGFKDEEDYDLYDNPLFADRTNANIFKNVRASSTIDNDNYNNESETKKIMEKIQKRGQMFEGAEGEGNKNRNSNYSRPIEFEHDKEEYGLNNIHSNSKDK